MKWILLLCLGLLAGAPEDKDIPFGALGKNFLKTHFKTENASDVPVEKMRDQQFVHGSFGVFTISFPVWSLGDKQHAEDLRSIVTAMLQIQNHWIDWIGKGDPDAAGPKADIETLLAWVKAWKPAGFAKADSATDKDLYALFGANEMQKTAATNLAAVLLKPDALGVAPKSGEAVRVVFAPTRRDFVEMLGYAGLLDSTQQAQLWTELATTWTSFWIGWDLVLALEYPPWAEDKEFKTGLSMNKFEPTGMLQHTVQQTMLAFLWACYGDGDALHFNQAEAMSMAIEVCGEINALEGEGGRGTTGSKTAPYSKFVPGGNPNGGILPPMSAAPFDAMRQNAWHEGLGRDYFVAPLRKGQKNALKYMLKEKPPGMDAVMAKDKNAHFLLTSLDAMKKYVVSAPFFGAFTNDKPYPPQEVIADYREFFRAYKCSFNHWLQTQGDKAGADASAAKYEMLMEKLAVREAGKTIDDLLKDVYGVPLSGKNSATDSLEWRFLDYLGKGK